MKTSISVTRTKFSLDKIIDRLQRSIENEVRVGFFAEDSYPDGMQVANVAAIQDNGSPAQRMPPRPFMHVGLLRALKSSPYLKMYSQLLQKILMGKLGVNAAYSQIGRFASEDLKQIISEWSSPPNSLSTQIIKGFNDPLVDSGTMMNSAKSKIGKARKKQSKYKMRNKPTKVG